MGYYIRLLTPSEKIVPFHKIKKKLKSIKLVEGKDEKWNLIELYDSNDRLIAVAKRNPVSKGGLAEEELKEFEEEIDDYYPESAGNWLKKYFKKVKTIYAFQIFTSTITKDGWDLLDKLREFLHEQLSGIIQADNEGFSNEEGYHILWQFSEDVSGEFEMATLNEKGEWITYKIDLSDKKAVEMFKKGIIPKKSRRRRK